MSSAAEQARRAYQRSTMSLGERVEALERQVDGFGTAEDMEQWCKMVEHDIAALREELGPVGVTKAGPVMLQISAESLDHLHTIEDAARALVMMPTPTGDAERMMRWDTLAYFIARTKP